MLEIDIKAGLRTINKFTQLVNVRLDHAKGVGVLGHALRSH